MTNAVLLEQIGEGLYGGRWKADLAADLGLSARTLRLYASKTLAVPDSVVGKARGLARARAEALLALAGDAAPFETAAAEIRRPIDEPLDIEVYLALAKRLGNQRPANIAQRTWEARNSTEHKVRRRETGVPMILKKVGTFRLQLWSDTGRLESFDIRTEKGRMAMRDLTLADPV